MKTNEKRYVEDAWYQDSDGAIHEIGEDNRCKCCNYEWTNDDDALVRMNPPIVCKTMNKEWHWQSEIDGILVTTFNHYSEAPSNDKIWEKIIESERINFKSGAWYKDNLGTIHQMGDLDDDNNEYADDDSYEYAFCKCCGINWNEHGGELFIVNEVMQPTRYKAMKKWLWKCTDFNMFNISTKVHLEKAPEIFENWIKIEESEVEE